MCTVHPKKYAHGFVVLCFVVVMQSFIMNSHVVFIHIHQGCFAGPGAIVRLPQCHWSKPDGYGNQPMYNHNKAQQSKNRVHISWDILYKTCDHKGIIKGSRLVNISLQWLYSWTRVLALKWRMLRSEIKWVVKSRARFRNMDTFFSFY